MWIANERELAKQQLEAKRATESRLDTLSDMKKEISKYKDGSDDLRRVVSQLVSIYPQLKEKMDSYGTSVAAVTEEIRKLNEEETKNWLLKLGSSTASTRETLVKTELGGSAYYELAKLLGAEDPYGDLFKKRYGSYAGLLEKIKEKEKERWEVTDSRSQKALDNQITKMVKIKGLVETQLRDFYRVDEMLTDVNISEAQRKRAGVEFSTLRSQLSKYGILDPLTTATELMKPAAPFTPVKSKPTDLTDREKAELDRKKKAALSFEKWELDFFKSLNNKLSQAEISALKERGREKEAEQKIHEIKLSDLIEEEAKKKEDLRLQFETLTANKQSKYYKKNIESLEEYQLGLLEIEETYYGLRLFENERFNNEREKTDAANQKEADKFVSNLQKTREKDAKSLHKETVQTLRAEGKIRRVWNADVEKIEEELAESLEQIENDKQAKLDKLEEDWKRAKLRDTREDEFTEYDKTKVDIIEKARQRADLARRRAAADTKNAIFGKSPLEGFTSGIESANKSLGTLGDNVEKLTTLLSPSNQ